jgi:SAM-dependent methyltransferase
MDIKNIEINETFLYSGAEELGAMTLMKKYNTNITNILKRNIEDKSAILDFGAGIGTITSYMSNYPNLTCLEIDQRFVEVLKGRNYNVISDLSQIEDSSLSFIYSSDVLEHIHDDYQTIRDLTKKLKPNGKIVFYVPAFQILYSELDKKLGHFRRYDKIRFKNVFVEAGLEVEKINYCDSIGFFGSLFYKLFLSSEGNVNHNMVKFYDTYIFPISRFFDFFFKKLIGKNMYIVARKVS